MKLNLSRLLKHLEENASFPKVKSLTPIKYAKTDIGKITELAQIDDDFRISVWFKGCYYHTWFYWIEKDDKRKKYFSELEILGEPHESDH